MRALFRLVQEIKTWMRKEIPDPHDRLYTTYVFIVAAVLHLRREKIPATKSEIISLTTVSASTVNRALPVLSELGLLKTDGKVWDFAVIIPDYLLTGDFGIDNNGQIKSILSDFKEELKSTIAAMQSTGRSGQLGDIDAIFEAIDETEAKQVEKKGAKGLMGDVIL